MDRTLSLPFEYVRYMYAQSIYVMTSLNDTINLKMEYYQCFVFHMPQGQLHDKQIKLAYSLITFVEQK